MRLLEIYDQRRARQAVIENAFDVTETQKLNGVWELSFSVPDGDDKLDYLQARKLVRYDGGALYRIIDYESDDGGAPVLTYTCEHMSAALSDRVMFGDHVRTGYTTAQNIEYILSFQADWVLAECDFTYRYDYAWTSENLLAALFSLSTPFTDYAKWVFDTSAYPYRLSLKKIDTAAKPEYYLFGGYNFLRAHKNTASGDILTRLYLLGYGEGINQLDVASVNDGKPYIESAEATAQYGLIERVYADRSLKEPGALLDAGKALLREGQRPREEYEVEAADVAELGAEEIYRARVGDVLLFKRDNYRTYITEISRRFDVAGDMSLTLSNTPEDLVKMLAGMADKQRIEATYAQGSTQIWGSVMTDNADSSHALKYPLWIPKELKVMNYVQVRIELGRFRAYSKGAASGGSSTTTTQSGGGSTSGTGGGQAVTSEAGGATTVSTETKVATNALAVGTPLNTTDSSEKNYSGMAGETATGGPSNNKTTWTQTPAQGVNHLHYMQEHTHSTKPHTHNIKHYHTGVANITIPSMQINIPGHTHTVRVAAHTHSTPNHSHSVSFPAHSHEISYGIYEASDGPASAVVKINGVEAFVMEKEWEGDISGYLIGSDGKIPRGRFINIEVRPNTMARVTVAVAPQGFIQSTGGGKY